MSSVERAEITQKEVLTMSNTVPVDIQERLDALERRRLEIISENAVDRTVAEYAVARIAERKAEKSRLKIEARALRMAVDAYAAQSIEVEDLEGLRWAQEQRATQAALPEIVEVEQELESDEAEITEVEQPKEGVGAKEPLAERILRRLKDADGPLTRGDVSQLIGEDPDRISTELTRMKRRKLVEREEGQGWTIP